MDDGAITRETVSGAAIRALWDSQESAFSGSRERIRKCKDLQSGKKLFQLPEDFKVPGKDNLVASLPQKQVNELKAVAALAKDRPKIKRYPAGESLTAKTRASAIETVLNAVMEAVFDYRGLVGRLRQQGECAVIALPLPAHWEAAPTLYDADGKIREEFVRDVAGKAPEDAGYAGRRSGRQTARAHAEALRDWMARHIPLEARIVPAADCLPLLSASTDAYGPKTDGLLVRTLFTREQLLQKGYLWDPAAAYVRRTDQQATRAARGGDCYLYEFWWCDRNGPWVAYSIDGADTQREDVQADSRTVVIDLRETHGLSRLPCKYLWGGHWETDDYDERGIPHLAPIANTILNAEAAITANLVHLYETAFGGWGYTPDPAMPQEAYLEKGQPRKFTYEPMKAILLPGAVTPLVHPGAGGDVQLLIRLLLTMFDDTLPAEAIFGGGSGSKSAVDRTLAKEYAELAEAMVLEGARVGYEFAASIFLEAMCFMAKKADASFAIYANVEAETTVLGERRAEATRQLAELKPAWVGGNYDVEAEFPPKERDNLALMQTLFEHHLKGGVTWAEYREKAHGDEHPELTQARIFVDKYYTQDPNGIALVRALADQLRAADQERELEELLATGRFADRETPTGMLAGVEAPPQDGHLTGTAVPNFAQSQLGGIVAGQMGTAALTNISETVAQSGAAPGGGP